MRKISGIEKKLLSKEPKKIFGNSTKHETSFNNLEFSFKDKFCFLQIIFNLSKITLSLSVPSRIT